MRKTLPLLYLLPFCAFAAQDQAAGLFQQQMNAMMKENTVQHVPEIRSADFPEKAGAEALSPDITVNVESVHFSGNSLIPDSELAPLTEKITGQARTLAELQSAVQRITDYYHEQGYLLSRAYLPPQTLSGGRLTINISEARYGQLHINNSSEVRSSLVESTLSDLSSGAPVHTDALNRGIGLLQNLNGVQISSAFSPGTEPGRSDLTVNIQPGQKWSGRIGVDANGGESTGRFRLYAQAGVNNVLGLGDRLSLYGLTSGKGLNYLYSGFETPVNGYGTRLGMDVSAMHYRADGELSASGTKGDAFNAVIRAVQPLRITADTRLNLSLAAGRNTLRNRNIVSTDKKHIDSATLSLDGILNDSGGSTAFTAGLTAGRLTFDTAESAQEDLRGRKTAGAFRRFNFDLSRRQYLSGGSVLEFRLNGQYSPDNLDGAEQFQLGGTAQLRGYGGGALYGSSGYALSADWYKPLSLPLPGQWQGHLSAGHGAVWVNPDRSGISGSNHGQISSAGATLHWFGADGWSADLTAAVPLGRKPDLLSGRDKYRIWAGFKKDF